MKKVVIAFILLMVFSCTATMAATPTIEIQNIQLTRLDATTQVELTIKSNIPMLLGYIYVVNPMRAVLRDNLGNEYKPLGLAEGSEELAGTIGNGASSSKLRTGTIIFPQLKRGIKLISFIIELEPISSSLPIAPYVLTKTWDLTKGK